MTESKIKKYRMTIWVPVLVFLIGIGLLSPMVHLSHFEHKEHLQSNAGLNAETYSERMKSELNKGVTVTTALEQILISEKGEINDFDIVAKNLITNYIQSIQLAPNGVVTQCYPPATARYVGFDVFGDSQSTVIAEYARDHDKITVQGPFTLSQGGEGIVIRNPVYLAKEDDTPESQEFWGFTVVVIKVPKIFENSIEALDSFGYDYRLTKESSIDESDSKTVFSSGAELTTPAAQSFTLGCSTWTLEVMPHGGWNAGDKAPLVCAIGMLIVLLFTALALITLILTERHHKYKQLATVDILTGLLNRAGFENTFTKYLSSHEGEPCVAAVLDIDDFKFVNDLYGHAIGDNALRHLAGDLVAAFPKNAILSRSGGDEFNIVLEGCTAEDAAGALERFVEVQRTFFYGGEKHSYTVSLGYAEYPTQAKTRAELSNRSDIALYEAKLRGKHTCLLYDKNFHFEKRAGLGFALNDISQHLPGAFLIYKADPADDTMLFANNEMVRLAGCDSLEDFMNFCGRRFSGLVHPEDLSRVETSIWEQIESKSDGTNDYVKFRFARKDGTYTAVLDHGRIVDSANYGRVFYVLMTDAGFLASHYSEEDENDPSEKRSCHDGNPERTV